MWLRRRIPKGLQSHLRPFLTGFVLAMLVTMALVLFKDSPCAFAAAECPVGSTAVFTATGNPLTVTNSTDNASVQLSIFEGDRATTAANDEAYLTFRLSDSAGNQDEFFRLTVRGNDVTSATEDASVRLYLREAGTLQEFFNLNQGHVAFSRGAAVTATLYSIGRDADGTNQAHWNVPTGATFELSVNDVAEATLSATVFNLQDNGLTTTGNLLIGTSASAQVTGINVTANANSIQLPIGPINLSTGANAGIGYTGMLSDSASAVVHSGRVDWQKSDSFTSGSAATYDSNSTFRVLQDNVLTTFLTLNGNLGVVQTASTVYLQFQSTSAGAPTATDCDADAERGRLVIDTSNNLLYLCNGATRGWDYITLTN